MRTDMITLACGAIALMLYVAGQTAGAGIAVAVGVVVLVWSVLTKS